jgi:hypothetical protein
MIWQDKAFLSGYFLAIIIAQCYWQRALFRANKPISHFWHGVYYALTAAVMCYFFMPVWWKVAAIAVMTRLAFFDILLSAIRGTPLFYNGKGTTGSLQDRLENHLSSWAIKTLKVLYVALFVIVLILL